MKSTSVGLLPFDFFLSFFGGDDQNQKVQPRKRENVIFGRLIFFLSFFVSGRGGEKQNFLFATLKYVFRFRHQAIGASVLFAAMACAKEQALIQAFAPSAKSNVTNRISKSRKMSVMLVSSTASSNKLFAKPADSSKSSKNAPTLQMKMASASVSNALQSIASFIALVAKHSSHRRIFNILA